MKQILFVSFFTCLFSGLSAQKQQTIEGNGNIITRNMPVKSFNSIDVSGVFELKMTQGDQESVKLEGDENLLQYISVQNTGSELVIDMEKLKNINFKTKKSLQVHLTFKRLDSMEFGLVGNVVSVNALKFNDIKIKNTGVGNVDLDLTAQSIQLKNKGVGDITLKGTASNASIMSAGVGSVDAASFAVQTMNVDISGVGSAKVNAAKDVKVKSNGLGSVKNVGAAPMPKKLRTTVI